MDTARCFLDLNRIQPRRSSLGALLIDWVQGGAGDGAFCISEEVSAAVLVNSTLNRKALSNLAIEDPAAFKAVVEAAKKALEA